MAANIDKLVNRLESVTAKLEALVAHGGAARPVAAVTPVAAQAEASGFVKAFDDEIINNAVQKFLKHCNDIGGLLTELGNHVRDGFNAQRAFLSEASRCKKPSDAVLNKMLEPTAKHLTAIQQMKDKNGRDQKYGNHISGIAESIAALGWVQVTPAPGPHVKDMSEAGQFYTNRVLKDYKEKDPRQADWVKSWYAVLTHLQAYIKAHHTTGVTWNPKGVEASGAPPPPAGGAPPPPPPPPAVLPPSNAAPSKADENAAAKSALFSDLNKGTAVTAGLKKVTDDMKTHKNPALRTGPKPFVAPKPGSSPPAAKKPEAKQHPPKLELVNKKWIVEYQEGNQSIVLDNVDIKQTVYIFKCKNSTIQIKGKVNSVIVDSCLKVGVVVENVLACVEAINCQRLQCQVIGTLPTVTIDKTDGCQLYLSEKSRECEIVASKTSELNVLLPKDDGDFAEFAVPEQFKTKWDGKKLVTTSMDLNL